MSLPDFEAEARVLLNEQEDEGYLRVWPYRQEVRRALAAFARECFAKGAERCAEECGNLYAHIPHAENARDEGRLDAKFAATGTCLAVAAEARGSHGS